MSVLESLGIDKEAYEQAEGKAATEAFKPLPSGVYAGVVESIIVYKGKYGTNMNYKVRLNESDRIVSFGSDIGKTLKGGKDNGGYASRLKSFIFATGVQESDLSMKEGAKVSSYGTEYTGSEIVGVAGKPVFALLKLVDSLDKPDSDQYKFQNELEGVARPDGLDATGANAKEVFETKIAERPVFGKKGKTVKPAAGAGVAGAAPGITSPQF